MSELLQIALDHHLYVFVLGGAAWWALNRWGGGTPKRGVSGQRRPEHPAKQKTTVAGGSRVHAGSNGTDRAGEPAMAAELLQAQLARLQAQRGGIAQRIATLEAEAAGDRTGSRSSGGSAQSHRKKRRR